MTDCNDHRSRQAGVRSDRLAERHAASGAVFDVLEADLEGIGFTVHRFTAGGPPDGPVEICSRHAEAAAASAFAGHLDVVPPGRLDRRSVRAGGPGRAALRPRRRRQEAERRLAAAARAFRNIRTLSLIITGTRKGRPSTALRP
jgi:succinyl-diaminopimelate desuccinylase